MQSRLNQNLQPYLSKYFLSLSPFLPSEISPISSFISFHENGREEEKREGENNKAVPHYRRADANLVAQLPRS